MTGGISGHFWFVYVLFAIGLFVFLCNEIKISNIYFQQVIKGIAKHSFTVYLVHIHVYQYITNEIVNVSRASISFVLKTLVTLVLSLVVAVILDYCIIYPIKKGLTHIMLRTENYK